MVASLVETSFGDGTSVRETASANAPTPNAAKTTKIITIRRTQRRFGFGFDLRALDPAVALGLATRFAGLRGVLTMTSLTGKAQVGQMRADLVLHEITGGG